MTFILAEKPSVAASFAAALEVPRKDGFWRNADYTVTNCIGHLLSLYDAADYDGKYQKWNVEDLPVIPVTFRHKPAGGTTKQLELIQKLLCETYDRYIIATDAGREGELIARLVLEYSGLKDYSRVLRFWTSSALTKEVILENLTNCKPASDYDGLYLSGLYRQLADWLTGINFSRFFTKKFDGRFIFGRVQTPVLAMIVSRENEIKAFVKSSFYRLRVTSSFSGLSFTSFLVDEAGEKNQDEKAALERLLPRVPGSSLVTDATVERKTLLPPKLFDLTELQKTANVQYGFTAAKTLELAQSLYEKHKCLSYPRTASRYLSRVNHELFLLCLEKLGIERGEADVTNTNIFNDEAMEQNKEDHHALILTGKLPEDSSEDEKKIYGLVFTAMATVVKTPHVYDALSLTHEGNGLRFTSSGVKVLKAGWKEKTAPPEGGEDGDETEQSQELPLLAKGDALSLLNPRITSHERKPPTSFTEAALLSAMKQHGLGTVATRDSIIEGLIKNEYCLRKGKAFLPAEKALFFIKAVRDLGEEELTKYLEVSTTGTWEAMLEEDAPAFFERVKDFVAKTIESLKKKEAGIFRASFGTCPVCGGDIVSGRFGWYCSRRAKSAEAGGAAEGSGCPFSIGKTICGAALTEADIKALLTGRKTDQKTMKSKAGKEFKAALSLDGSFKIRFEFDTEKTGNKKT